MRDGSAHDMMMLAATSVATWGPTQVAREMHKNSQIVAKKYFEVAKKVAKY